MVFAPIRGIFMLGRTAFIIAAAAAVPVLLKKNRKLADQVGSTLIKAGEKLKQEYGGADEIKKEDPAKTTSAPASDVRSTSAKPKAQVQAQSKPSPASKRGAKKNSAKPASKRKAAKPKPTA